MHSWNCPNDYEARRQARWDAQRDQSSGWGRSYSSPYDCDHASEEYRRTYEREYQDREREAAEERRAQAAREQARQEEEWAIRQAEEEYYRQQEEAHWLERQEAYYAELRDSDRSGEAVETTGSTEGESAGPEGVSP